jgi:hypothetical protein
MDDRTLRAIARLAEALHLLSDIRDQGDTPSVPIRIGENQINVTPRVADALSDAIDSMNAYMASDEPFIGKLEHAARHAGLLEGLAGEHIPTGEWTAAAVAQNHTALYADVTDAFLLVDPLSYLDDVLTSREPEAAAAAYEQLVTGEWDGEL